MRRRALVGALGACLMLAAPAAAAPKPLSQALEGQAKADYDAGKTGARDGDFAGALIKFQRAYDASKDPRLLWNVAYCEKNMRHYARVLALLRRYLAEGNGYLTDKDRTDAQDLITAIEPFTTNAHVTVSQDGAQVFVDDASVGTTPLPDPVVLDIGERVLRVTKDGFKPYEKTITVGGTVAVAVNVTLDPLVHQGRLVVNAPPDATITIDDRPAGSGGNAAVDVPSGKHQLRATAPGMRPYQTEVVVQDEETRQLDVAFERESAAEKPRLRVAIGCDDQEPRGPEDGLVVYLDGSPTVLPPVGVEKRWDEHQGRNVVQYAEYAVDAGLHTVRARVTGCNSLDTQVTVDPQSGATVTGALEPDAPPMMQGPQGSPGHWRFGAGLWLLSMPSAYQSSNMTEVYQADSPAAATGCSLEGAYVTRWLGVFLELADGYGSMKRQTFATNDALPSSPSMQTWASTLRASFRLPLRTVSWNVVGPEGGIGGINLQGVNTGDTHLVYGAWTGLDVQPACDWGASIAAKALFQQGERNSSGFTAVLQAGVFWEPNPQCRRERATTFGIRSSEAAR